MNPIAIIDRLRCLILSESTLGWTILFHVTVYLEMTLNTPGLAPKEYRDFVGETSIPE